MDKKILLRFCGIILAIISLTICSCFTIKGLNEQAMKTLGVLLAALFMLIFESFGVCITCLLSSVLLFLFGCTDSISAAFSGYSNHILYFTTASFGVSLAFRKSGLSQKLLRLLVRGEKTGTKKIIFTFMFCAALLSAVMSNVAAIVIFLPFAEDYLCIFKDETKREKTTRSMFICIAVSVLIGGMMTPAGSSMNLICIDMLERYTGETIRFIDWMKVGIPLALFMLAAAFLVITFIYRPYEPEKEELEGYILRLQKKTKLSRQGIYTGIVIGGVVFAWILSSWVPAINVTAAAVIGLALFFLPGAEVMTWEEFSGSISWATFFIAGTLISIADSVTKTGLSEYLAAAVFPTGTTMAPAAAVAVVAAVTFMFMAVLPSAPAVITILAPVIIDFAGRAGVNPVMLLLACSLCVSNIYLFPLDAPLAVVYDRKAFGMFDLPKATIWLQFIMIAAVSLWVPLYFR